MNSSISIAESYAGSQGFVYYFAEGIERRCNPHPQSTEEYIYPGETTVWDWLKAGKSSV
ncbi:hypothetical protein [Reichenbachiella sp.]|uniref:hypothetical protein n=1 Tax=Reichenbachiella sp. TaxID=2184521 RepID=UPI003BB18CFC